MQPDMQKNPQSTNDAAGGAFALLQYEINRVKQYLEINGESAVMRERLNRLEALLKLCLSVPDNPPT